MKISSPGLCKAVRQLCFHRGSIDSGWAKGTSVRSVFNSRGLCSHVVNGTRCKHPGRYHRVGNCCNDWRQCLAIRAGGLWLCEIGASLSLSLSLSTSQDDHTWNRMDLVAEKDSKASHSGDAPAWQEQDGCVAGQESMRLQAGRRVA